MMTRKLWGLSLLTFGLFAGCSSDDVTGDGDACPQGTDTCACYDDNTCNGTLVCQQGTCYALGSTGDGDGDGTGGFTTGDGDGDATGGMSGDGDGDGDGDATGGMGGSMGGMGGMGGGDPNPDPGVTCEDGCALLTVPFAAFDTGTDFEIQYDPTLDLTSATVTARIYVEMEGNAGGIQLYAKNGADQSYASKYSGWNNLSGFTSDWVDLSLDLSVLADPDGGFSKSEVLWIGINVATGSDYDGAVLGDVHVYIEDIMFTAGGTDHTFAVDVEDMKVNINNSPIENSTVVHYP